MKAVYNRIKETVFQIIEPSKGNLASKIVDLIIIVLIVANTVIVIAETFDLPEGVSKAMGIFEGISVIIFTVEYLLRVWTSDLLHPEMNPLKARLKYVFSFMAIVDLVAILPFYLPLVFPIDLRIIRIMRVVRLFRIFKINRYTNALRIIALVFKNKSAQLVSSVFVVNNVVGGLNAYHRGLRRRLSDNRCRKDAFNGDRVPGNRLGCSADGNHYCRLYRNCHRRGKSEKGKGSASLAAKSNRLQKLLPLLRSQAGLIF